MTIKVLTVIQARTGSSRLPNKVLLSLSGKPLLLRMYERVSFSKEAGHVLIATSTNSEDDVIEKLCIENGIDFFRGHPTDLLERHYKAAVNFQPDAVVKIPSDCPLIDYRIIDRVISKFKDDFPKYDFFSNLHPASYPDGNDVEIFKFPLLEEAFFNAKKDFEREHTTPYFWENEDKFSVGNVLWESGLDYSASHRWTIDYEEDYIFIRTVYDELYEKKNNFSLYDILNLLKEKPYIEQINKEFAGRYWYDKHLDELKNIEEYKKKKKK